MSVKQEWRGKDANGIVADDEEKPNRVSRMLIAQVLEFAKENGCKKVYLKTGAENIGAQKTYTDAGFVMIDDIEQIPEQIRSEIERKQKEKNIIDCAFVIELK